MGHCERIQNVGVILEAQQGDKWVSVKVLPINKFKFLPPFENYKKEPIKELF